MLTALGPGPSDAAPSKSARINFVTIDFLYYVLNNSKESVPGSQNKQDEPRAEPVTAAAQLGRVAPAPSRREFGRPVTSGWTAPVTAQSRPAGWCQSRPTHGRPNEGREDGRETGSMG